MRTVTAGLSAALLFGVFLGLGTWQIERRAWKIGLIERVERRVHAAAVDAPLRAEWPSVTAASHEYLRVRATGAYLPASQTRVQALTELGSGFWLMTPLRMSDGGIVLVNRGFVTGERIADAAIAGPHAAAAHLPAAAPVPATVTGLLRMTEPKGGFLRRNDPANDRWFSRDVQAIAAARGLGRVAPYFIDAEGSGWRPDAAAAGRSRIPGDAEAPVGGLTVITFHNNHLIYAITWYTLAFMIPAALWLARRPNAAANAS